MIWSAWSVTATKIKERGDVVVGRRWFISDFVLWATWKERNRIVFEDATFSFNRLKMSFITALISWAG